MSAATEGTSWAADGDSGHVTWASLSAADLIEAARLNGIVIWASADAWCVLRAPGGDRKLADEIGRRRTEVEIEIARTRPSAAEHARWAELRQDYQPA